MAESAGLLIRPESLFHILALPDLVVLDSRGEQDYQRGHIVGAVHLSPSALERDIILDNGETVSNMLTTAEASTGVLRRAGINADSRVVVYDAGGGCSAARLFWALESLGISRVQLLDGGYDGWRDEVGIVTREEPSPTLGTVEARIDERRMADFSDVLTGIGQGSKSLCNTLSTDDFSGGAIPTSVNVPYYRTYTGGRYPVLRTPEELRELFLGVGGTLEREMVFYCRIGYFAAQCYFAARVAGFQRVRLYDGSMQDWVQRGGRLLPSGRGV